ncbi:hypothetical protein KY361_07305 [Candidatus Woesearchaeota archaeon]|nr:hypothetical protein [Candidatus Woesearchaeota archaeon]
MEKVLKSIIGLFIVLWFVLLFGEQNEVLFNLTTQILVGITGFYIGYKIYKRMRGKKEKSKEKPTHKYYCSKCKTKVKEDDVKCPKCNSLLAVEGAVIIKKKK